MHFGDEWADMAPTGKAPWRPADFVKFPAAFFIQPIALVVRRPVEALFFTAITAAVAMASYQMLNVWDTLPSWIEPVRLFVNGLVRDKIPALAISVFFYFVLRFGQHLQDRKRGRATWSDAYWDWLFNGEMGVLVLGIGGSGKSTLGSVLQYEHKRQRIRNFFIHARYRDLGEIEDIVAQPYDSSNLMGAGRPYQVSDEVERYRIGYCRTMKVAPGQYEAHDLWRSEIKKLAKFRRAVVIHVTTFGYAAPYRFSELSIEELAKNESVSVDNFESEYTAKKRDDEFRAAEKLTNDLLSEISPQKTKLVVINLVNMAGFWWTHREAVGAHYGEARFALLTQALESAFAKGRLVRCQCGVMPASLLFDNLSNDPTKTGRPKEVIFGANESHRVELKRITSNVVHHIRTEVYRWFWPKKRGVK